VSAKLRERYEETVGDDGPSEHDVVEAFRTIGGAAQAVLDSMGTAMRDPEVRRKVREAAAGLVSALGNTFSELGDELAREEPAEGDE
jgi:hypothetical protein